MQVHLYAPLPACHERLQSFAELWCGAEHEEALKGDDGDIMMPVQVENLPMGAWPDGVRGDLGGCLLVLDDGQVGI